MSGFPKGVTEFGVFKWLEKNMEPGEGSEIRSVHGKEGKALIQFNSKRAAFT